MNHAAKHQIEEVLIESNLPYTILQPGTFMDNIPIGLLLLASQDDPVFPAAWSTVQPFSWLALADLAHAMRTVLDERERHFYATYPLVSTTELVSF
ncbi:hypothetical protein K504DRAFT_461693 [Pleomassaria siparia CBS 279.74]|uniref:NmrA-like domain-containing protein n=1 Tax=Pleomassaria siparia CBS 279.74 TaxID=1314801 RepID=A0A6G1KJV7_9PLEO|nr:hypothetical protein K504DRAFT_461693 [Pleomassaria siparia CBS 279.74]